MHDNPNRTSGLNRVGAAFGALALLLLGPIAMACSPALQVAGGTAQDAQTPPVIESAAAQYSDCADLGHAPEPPQPGTLLVYAADKSPGMSIKIQRVGDGTAFYSRAPAMKDAAQYHDAALPEQYLSLHFGLLPGDVGHPGNDYFRHYVYEGLDPAQIFSLATGETLDIPAIESSKINGIESSVDASAQVTFLGCASMDVDGTSYNVLGYRVKSAYRSVTPEGQAKTVTLDRVLALAPVLGWWLQSKGESGSLVAMEIQRPN